MVRAAGSGSRWNLGNGQSDAAGSIETVTWATATMATKPKSRPILCDDSDVAAATQCYSDPHGLSPKQLTAISALSIGLSDEAAARYAGVHRVTVTRWRLDHEAFRAAFLERMQEKWAEAADQLTALIPQAMDTLKWPLECADDRTRVRTAIEIVKLTRTLSSPTLGAGAMRSVPSLSPSPPWTRKIRS